MPVAPPRRAYGDSRLQNGPPSRPAPPRKVRVSFPTPTQRLVGSKNAATNAFGTPTALNVRGLQQQLAKMGYKITVDGRLGPETLSALRDATGQANEPLGKFKTELATPNFLTNLAKNATGHPQMWDKTHVDVQAPYRKTTTNPDGTSSTSGASSTPFAGTPTGGSSAGTVNYSPLSGLVTKTGRMLPASLAQFGQMVNPSTAQDIAGAQYDPQIAAAQLQLQLDPGQFAQDLKDIGSWYGQAEGAQQAAGKAVAGMGTAAVGSMGDAAAALAQSMGGNANMGGANIASTGQNAIGTEQALANAANTYETNMGPLLKAEQAEQSVNQQNKNATQALTDRQALASLQSAKGQATQAALAQIIGQNNSLAQARASMEASLAQNNNALGQQNFSNQLALLNSMAQAQSLGINTQYKQAELNNLASEIQSRTQKNDLPAYAANHPFTYYQQHNPQFLSKVAQTARTALYDPTGVKASLTPQQAWDLIKSVYVSNGMAPNPGTPSYNAGQGILNAWMNG